MYELKFIYFLITAESEKKIGNCDQNKQNRSIIPSFCIILFIQEDNILIKRQSESNDELKEKRYTTFTIK